MLTVAIATVRREKDYQTGKMSNGMGSIILLLISPAGLSACTKESAPEQYEWNGLAPAWLVSQLNSPRRRVSPNLSPLFEVHVANVSLGVNAFQSYQADCVD